MITHNGAEGPFSTLLAQVAGELQHWRRHEAERGPMPGGGLDTVWPQCVAIYGIALRSPGIDEAQALAAAVADRHNLRLSEQERRQIFTLVWPRSVQLRIQDGRPH